MKIGEIFFGRDRFKCKNRSKQKYFGNFNVETLCKLVIFNLFAITFYILYFFYKPKDTFNRLVSQLKFVSIDCCEMCTQIYAVYSETFKWISNRRMALDSWVECKNTKCFFDAFAFSMRYEFLICRLKCVWAWAWKCFHSKLKKCVL